MSLQLSPQAYANQLYQRYRPKDLVGHKSHALLPKQRNQTKATYDSLVGVIPTAVRGGQGGGALLSIPGGQALL